MEDFIKTLPETPEGIAYKLMLDIFAVEGKLRVGMTVPRQNLTKDDILNTYKECIVLVKSGYLK